MNKTCVFMMLISTSLAFSDIYAAPATVPCFDFNNPIKEPLRNPPAARSKKDIGDSGNLPLKGGVWGYARGQVNYPIESIYQKLLDHYTIKDPKRAKLKVYPQDRPGFRDFHVVMVKAILPAIDIHWEEDWGYVVTEGTEAAPKKIVISYQKTNGTEYMPHLCGSIVLNAVDSKSTDVYLYEEVNAFGKRSHKDTVHGHFGTLSTLRKAQATASK